MFSSCITKKLAEYLEFVGLDFEEWLIRKLEEDMIKEMPLDSACPECESVLILNNKCLICGEKIK